MQYIDHLQNRNPTWLGQEIKVIYDQNHVFFFLIKDEANFLKNIKFNFWNYILYRSHGQNRAFNVIAFHNGDEK